jgi:hypothetical protein
LSANDEGSLYSRMSSSNSFVANFREQWYFRSDLRHCCCCSCLPQNFDVRQLENGRTRSFVATFVTNIQCRQFWSTRELRLYRFCCNSTSTQKTLEELDRIRGP